MAAILDMTMLRPNATASRLLAPMVPVLLTIRLLVFRIIVQFWPRADRGSSVASEVRVPLTARSVLLRTCARLTSTWASVLLTRCRRGLSTASGRARSGWPVQFLTSSALPPMAVLTCTCTCLTPMPTSRTRLCMLGMIPPVVLAGADVCRLVIRLSSA